LFLGNNQRGNEVAVKTYEEYNAIVNAEIEEWLPVEDIDWAARRIAEILIERFGDVEPDSRSEFYIRETIRMRLAERMGVKK